MGWGWGGEDRECRAEWQLPGVNLPDKAPKTEGSDPTPSQEAPGAAHSLATGLANHRLRLPQTGASLLSAPCSLASDISFTCLLLPPLPDVLECGLDDEVFPRCLREGVFLSLPLGVTQNSVARTLG